MRNKILILVIMSFSACNIVPNKPCSREDVKATVLSLFKSQLDSTTTNIKDSISDIFSSPSPVNDNKCSCEGTVYFYLSEKDYTDEQNSQRIKDMWMIKKMTKEGFDYLSGIYGIGGGGADQAMWNRMMDEFARYRSTNSDTTNTLKYEKLLNSSNPDVKTQIISLCDKIDALQEKITEIEKNPQGWGKAKFYKQVVKYEVKTLDDGKIEVELER